MAESAKLRDFRSLDEGTAVDRVQGLLQQRGFCMISSELDSCDAALDAECLWCSRRMRRTPLEAGSASGECSVVSPASCWKGLLHCSSLQGEQPKTSHDTEVDPPGRVTAEEVGLYVSHCAMKKVVLLYAFGKSGLLLRPRADPSEEIELFLDSGDVLIYLHEFVDLLAVPETVLEQYNELIQSVKDLPPLEAPLLSLKDAHSDGSGIGVASLHTALPSLPRDVGGQVAMEIMWIMTIPQHDASKDFLDELAAVEEVAVLHLIVFRLVQIQATAEVDVAGRSPPHGSANVGVEVIVCIKNLKAVAGDFPVHDVLRALTVLPVTNICRTAEPGTDVLDRLATFLDEAPKSSTLYLVVFATNVFFNDLPDRSGPEAIRARYQALSPSLGEASGHVVVGTARFCGEACEVEDPPYLDASGLLGPKQPPKHRGDLLLFWTVSRASLDTSGRSRLVCALMDGTGAAWRSLAVPSAIAFDTSMRLSMEGTLWRSVPLRSDKPCDWGLFCGLSGLPEIGCWSSWSSYTRSTPTVILGKVAEGLNFAGPARAVDTDDSSGLVACDMACHHLKSGLTSVALASSASWISSPCQLALHCAEGLASRSGRTRCFDQSGDGFTLGEGCVVLRLQPQQKSTWQIVGSAVNSRGRPDVKLVSAPSSAAMVDLMAQAQRDAGVPFAVVDAVETSSKGALSDALELKVLQQALAHGERHKAPVVASCAKATWGHLGACSGLASLARTLLLLGKSLYGPQLHLHQLLALEEAPSERSFACVVTLRQTGWEKFQIWLDRDPQCVLHPGNLEISDSIVLGPDDGVSRSQSWKIVGQPGDRFELRLQVNGKYKRVSWQKVSLTPFPPEYSSLRRLAECGAQEALWSQQEKNEFQIYVDEDFDQGFYPAWDLRAEPSKEGTDSGVISGEAIAGPDGLGHGRNFCISGTLGELIRCSAQDKSHARPKRRLHWEHVGFSEVDLEALAGAQRYYAHSGVPKLRTARSEELPQEMVEIHLEMTKGTPSKVWWQRSSSERAHQIRYCNGMQRTMKRHLKGFGLLPYDQKTRAPPRLIEAPDFYSERRKQDTDLLHGLYKELKGVVETMLHQYDEAGTEAALRSKGVLKPSPANEMS
eukprot:g33316.t1